MGCKLAHKKLFYIILIREMQMKFPMVFFYIYIWLKLKRLMIANVSFIATNLEMTQIFMSS